MRYPNEIWSDFSYMSHNFLAYWQNFWGFKTRYSQKPLYLAICYNCPLLALKCDYYNVKCPFYKFKQFRDKFIKWSRSQIKKRNPSSDAKTWHQWILSKALSNINLTSSFCLRRKEAFISPYEIHQKYIYLIRHLVS